MDELLVMDLASELSASKTLAVFPGGKGIFFISPYFHEYKNIKEWKDDFTEIFKIIQFEGFWKEESELQNLGL